MLFFLLTGSPTNRNNIGKDGEEKMSEAFSFGPSLMKVFLVHLLRFSSFVLLVFHVWAVPSKYETQKAIRIGF